MFTEEHLISATLVVQQNKITALRIKSFVDSHNPVYIIALCEALKTNTSIQHMDFGHILIAPYNTVDYTSAIADMLKHNSSITHLYLGGIVSEILRENVKEISTIFKALETNKTLERLNLSHAYVGNNGAIAIAEMLEVNQYLKAVDFSHNIIGDTGAIAIANMLEVNRHLTVDLRYNKIGDTGAIAIANMLKVNEHLEVVDLSHNIIGDTGAIALARALKDNTSCRKLDLSCNEKITIVSADAFIDLLTHNSVFEELNLYLTNLAKLTNNPDWGFWGGATIFVLETLNLYLANLVKTNVLQAAIVQNGLPFHVNYFEGSMVTSIKRNAPHICYLIRKNKVEDVKIKEQPLYPHIISTACEAIRNNISIKHLSFEKRWFTKEDMTEIANMLDHNSSIKALEIYLGEPFSENIEKYKKKHHLIIKEESPTNLHVITMACKALIYNTCIEDFSLSCNYLISENSAAIAMLLECNSSIKSISLSLGETYNNDKEISTIVKALEKNKTVERLFLNFAYIRDAGAIAIANMLKVNQHLEVVDLSHNRIDDTGAIALAKALKNNTSCRRLDLSCNKKITIASLDAFVDLLTHNPVLKELILQYTDLTKTNALQAAIDQNRLPYNVKFDSDKICQIVRNKPDSKQPSLIDRSSPLNTSSSDKGKKREDVDSPQNQKTKASCLVL